MLTTSDQAQRDQLRDHITGLESAASSVEVAVAGRPPGADRDQMISLAARLRRSADLLHDELEARRLQVPRAPALVNAADRD